VIGRKYLYRKIWLDNIIYCVFYSLCYCLPFFFVF